MRLKIDDGSNSNINGKSAILDIKSACKWPNAFIHKDRKRERERERNCEINFITFN